MNNLSPMMQQYIDIKQQHKDCILFFRLGDFYEMFFEDAKIASKELDLTLTGKSCGLEEKAPMCGIPYHSYEPYVQRLVKKGYKVAICEQESSQPTKGNKVVNRNLTRIITAGTILENSMLDESKNNYICSVFMQENTAAVAFCDVSTGYLCATFIDKNLKHQLLNEISSFNPSEMLLNQSATNCSYLVDFINSKLSSSVEITKDETNKDEDAKIISDQFGKTCEELKMNNSILKCVSDLLKYFSKTQIKGLQNIADIEIYSQSKYMGIDFNTRKNLELDQTLITGEKKGSLLWVLDKTKCPMGKRLLKTWVEQPLLNVDEINLRQGAVAVLKENLIICDDLRENLTCVHDMERLMTKVVYGSANARELVSLRESLKILPNIKKLLSKLDSKLLNILNIKLDTLEDVYNILEKALVDEPPVSTKEGSMIKPGFSDDLDKIKDESKNSTKYLTQIEINEREKTGIPKLKVAYNRVFGYYIEVTNLYKDKIPANYVRKQTLSNCERFITQELKELEIKLLTAKDRIINLELEIFEKIRTFVAEQNRRIKNTVDSIAKLDVLSSLAFVAVKQNYCRPKITSDGVINLKQSRHPVVEKLMKNMPFVANDVILDMNENNLLIITGPNMAGKSTYMRQIALISLMAQIGSFVPAQSAEISVVDQIFTRVGASDNLSSGQSTFMLEMNEVAQILKKATKNSLIILDEIGRGTSTYDGMSIARAVLEYCADKTKLGAKTLFSTHYHELTALEGQIDGVKNYSISVKKKGDDIIFLRRIIKGGADKSYGIEVAKLAGVPQSVIDRAKYILEEIESNRDVVYKQSEEVQNKTEKPIEMKNVDLKVINEFKNCDIETLSPIEALNFLYKIKNMLS